MRVRLFGASALLFISFTTGAIAETGTAKIGDVTLNLDPGPDRCLLDEEAHEFDQQILARYRKLRQGTGTILAADMECIQLSISRAAHPTRAIGGVTGLLSSLGYPEPASFPGVDRREFLPFLKQQFNHPGINDSFKKGIDAAAENAKEFSEAAVRALNEAVNLGVVAEDTNAIYSGVIVPGEPVVATVGGVTLIHGYVVNYTLSDEYENLKTIERLMNLSKEKMATLVSINP